MKWSVNYKRLSLSLILILLSIGTYQVYHTFAVPSGQIASIEGGGFCARTYRVFNNTGVDNMIYAENCKTGVNEYGPSTDTGSVVNSVIGAALSTTTFSSANIGIAGGLYNTITPINLFPKASTGGLLFEGDGAGQYYTTGGGNGTTFRAITAGMTVIKFCAAPPCPF